MLHRAGALLLPTVLVGLVACTSIPARDRPVTSDRSVKLLTDDAGYLQVQGPNRCDEDQPDPGIREIWIHREGGCLGYYSPAGDESGRPFFLTGPCAEYTLVLRSDGTAEYRGRDKVPIIGHRVGVVAPEVFRRLARMVEEIGFERWADEYPLASHKSGSVCVTMDGEGPVTISVRWATKQKRIQHDPDRAAPVWLTVFETELDKVGQAISWQ